MGLMAKENNEEAPLDLPLQTYVREVCLQILRGVVEAQGDESLGKFVGRAPVNADYKDEGSNSISIIDFDVSAEVAFSADGVGGISVASFVNGFNVTENFSSRSSR